jgi:hypothetical protein
MGISVVVSGECSDNAVDLYLRYWIFYTSYYDLEMFVVYLIFFQNFVITSSYTPVPFSFQHFSVQNSHLSFCIIWPSITSGPAECRTVRYCI